MTSTVAGYANKARRGEIKGVEPMAEERRDEGEGGAGRCIAGREIRENKAAISVYDGDPYIAMIERIRTPLSREEEGKGESQVKRKKMHFQAHTHFLPHEDVMDHGAPAKHDAEADEDRGDDRRCRVKLDECVQDHACGSHVHKGLIN